jgi:hypothetical protein
LFHKTRLLVIFDSGLAENSNIRRESRSVRIRQAQQTDHSGTHNNCNSFLSTSESGGGGTHIPKESGNMFQGKRGSSIPQAKLDSNIAPYLIVHPSQI